MPRKKTAAQLDAEIADALASSQPAAGAAQIADALTLTAPQRNALELLVYYAAQQRTGFAMHDVPARVIAQLAAKRLRGQPLVLLGTADRAGRVYVTDAGREVLGSKRVAELSKI